MDLTRKTRCLKQGFMLVLLFVTLTTLGCSKSESKFLSVGTAPPGGAFFVVGGAIAEVIGANVGDRPWQVSAEATKGTQENIRRLLGGELDLALANSAISYFAVRGQGAWEREYQVRTVMTLAPNVAFFITPRSSGVKTFSDLKGKRVVIGPAGAGFNYFVEPILKAHGVLYDELTVLHNTQAGTVDMLADGSAAAAFLGGAVPTSSITQASASQDILFVPFGESEIASLVEEYPFFEPATIPAGTYRNQDEAFSGMNVGSMHLITAAGVDEETIYQLTKILYEHREEVVKKHPAGRAINPKNVVKDTGTQFHPGAIRYYKEIGIWSQQRAAGSSASTR
jgi:TRAP transporter TAXI family solute receptor